MTGRRVALALRYVWQRLRLYRLVDWALPHTPDAVQRWARLRREQMRVSAGVRLVPERQLEAKYREALIYLRDRDTATGDYLEFGVYHGASLACMDRVSRDLGLGSMRLFGFDSFEGLPANADEPESGGVWKPGQYAVGEQYARAFLERSGVDPARVHLVKGWFNDTLTDRRVREHDIRKASVIMVDCDLYSSARDALEFCAPLIADEAIVFFDDWEAGVDLGAQNLGERRAYDEWLAEHPELAAAPFGSYEHTEMAEPARGEIFRVWRKPQLAANQQSG